MTNNRTDLYIQMVGDIPERLHLAVLKLSSSVIQAPPEQLAVLVTLPLRINFLRHPGNKLISSVEKKQTFLFTPQEVHTIETYAANSHRSKEDALKELVTVSLQEHTLLREIIVKARRKPSKETHIEVAVQLWGPISWNEKRADITTA